MVGATALVCCFCSWLQETFFLQRANCLGAEGHCNLLSINDKGLFLQVWFKDALRATQRKTDVVSRLLAFTGEFTS